MDLPRRKKRHAPRSRSGCLQCREHHRKCDEAKPSCSLCLELGRDCTYALRVRWGGRPFTKSTFGQCAGSSDHQPTPVVRVHSTESGLNGISIAKSSTPFVYSTVPSSLPRTTSADGPGTVTKWTCPGNDPVDHEGKLYLDRNICTLPKLTSTYRVLFEYFPRVADSFSCSEGPKNEFCRSFIPIAVETPIVMASALNLAAVHRLHSGLVQDTKQLAALQLAAVKQLRTQIYGHQTESIMVAIMLLCYSEVINGGAKDYSWRVHLEGAASLFSRDPTAWSIHSPNQTRAFIAKCFVSLVAIANISGCPPTTMVSEQALVMVEQKWSAPCIDDFLAYSSNLIPILCEIGSLAQERGHISSAMNVFIATQLELKSKSLINKLQVMIATAHKTALNSHTLYDIPPAHKEQYLNVNESYHHAAILQIQLRIRRLSPETEEMQEIVQHILNLLSQVNLHSGPCVGVVLFFPLFTAGCGATRLVDRMQIQLMLQRMADNICFQNIHKGLALLKKLWAHWDQDRDFRNAVSWDDFIDENIDFILY